MDKSGDSMNTASFRRVDGPSRPESGRLLVASFMHVATTQIHQSAESLGTQQTKLKSTSTKCISGLQNKQTMKRKGQTPKSCF